jgi:hypothetical protein
LPHDYVLKEKAPCIVCVPDPSSAGAIAIGAMMTVIAPAGHAEPIGEKTIKSACKSAGGTYQTSAQTGPHGRILRSTSCTYKDIDGDTWTDYYANGEYLGTDKGGSHL